MMTYADVLEEIRPMIADVLALEPQEVTPQMRFFGDLGGESIEILELSFRLEKRFGRKINLQSVVPARDLEVDENRRLTPASLAMMRERFPFLKVDAIADDPRADRIVELITVEAIARVVVEQLNDAPPPVCPAPAAE